MSYQHETSPQHPETNPYFLPIEPHQDRQNLPLRPKVSQPQPPHQSRQSKPGPRGADQLSRQQKPPSSPQVVAPPPHNNPDRDRQGHGQLAHQDRHGHGQRAHQDRHEHGQRVNRPWRPEGLRTKPLTWFAAVICAVLWVVIIIGGLIVLIVYLVYRPKSPQFEISSATLNAAYLDMGYLLNADVTILANITNPNKKVGIDFSYMFINLYYGSSLIGTQQITPFNEAEAQSKFQHVHLVSSQVRLPVRDSQRLKKQMDTNGVVLRVKGVFRARSSLGGLLHYSYWLYSTCTVIMAGPPEGGLIAHKCKTKR